MSYTGTSLRSVGGLFASGSKDEDYCWGRELADNDSGFCCPPKWWSNATYTQIKGFWSGYFRNESRVYHLLNLLLSPDTKRGFSTGLARIAYDGLKVGEGNLYLNPQFVERLKRAAHNFAVMFPSSRWYQKKGAVETDCAYYSVWTTDYQPFTDERMKAMENAVGEALPLDYKNAMRSSGVFNFNAAPPPPVVKNWMTRFMHVVSHVPGSEPEKDQTDLPSIHDSGILKKVSGNLAAGDWLSNFLDAFAPPFKGLQLSKAGMMMAPSTSGKLTLSKTALVSGTSVPSALLNALEAGASMPSDSDESTSGSGDWTSDAGTMLAIGGIVLGAVLIWNSRRSHVSAA